jgi:hypothetical protein
MGIAWTVWTVRKSRDGWAPGDDKTLTAPTTAGLAEIRCRAI